MDFNQEPKTKDDVKNMLKHLEDEYRKANITENTYKELKEKYKQQMSYMDNTINPEEAKMEAPLQAAEEPTKKGGLFGLLHKKKAEEPQPAVAPVANESAEEPTRQQSSGGNAAVQQLSIELEKLKVMLEAVRDQKKSTDESVQSLFESVGEVRSMSIQNDATEREILSKLEKTEDDMNNLKPKELEKRFTQINEVLEKYQLVLEKLQAKSNDMNERLGKVYESVRVIGNTENLAGLNQNVQKKLNDIREATNYVERLSSKAEKIFIDLKMELEDMVVFKSKQEAMEESIKDMLKNLDSIGIKFEGYTTKKEMEEEKQDIFILGKQQDDIKNAMAIVQGSVPEPILQLRKEREDIKLFLDSLDEQVKGGKIKAVDYETAKKNNIEKLKVIDSQLLAEWKKFEKMSKEAPAPVVNIVEADKPGDQSKDAKETVSVNDGVETQDTSSTLKAQTVQQENTAEKHETHNELLTEEKKEFIEKVEEKVKSADGVISEPTAEENEENSSKPQGQDEAGKKKKKIALSLPF